MDVFLIKDGKVENIVVVASMEDAKLYFPEYISVERDDSNKHVNPGDDWNEPA
jgi:hypothetical protein